MPCAVGRSLAVDILFALIGIVLATFMTLGLAGAVYEHRAALPMVAVMFVAVLVFGALW